MKKIFSWLRNEAKETSELLRKVPAVLMTFFVLSLVMMNILANKSLDIQLSWLALDAGICVSWLAFLSMDVIVKAYGPKASTRLTLVATGINVLVSVLFALAATVPGFWGESFVDVGGESINLALNNTIGGTWYILLASTIAFVIAGISNNVLNWLIGRKIKKNPDGFRAYAIRSWISTVAAQFIDNLVFALIISLNFFGWSWLQCITCALTGALVELLLEILFSPIGYRLAKRCTATQRETHEPQEEGNSQTTNQPNPETLENTPRNNAKMVAIPKYLSIRQAHNLIKKLDPETAVREYTIRKWCKDGTLPYIVNGTRWEIETLAYIEFMNIDLEVAENELMHWEN